MWDIFRKKDMEVLLINGKAIAKPAIMGLLDNYTKNILNVKQPFLIAPLIVAYYDQLGHLVGNNNCFYEST